MLVRRLLKTVLIVLALLAVLVALGPAILSTGPGRALVEGYLASRLGGRKVSIERLDVGWMSGVDVEEMVISERPGFGDDPFIAVGGVRFPNSLFSLLGSDARLDALTVTDLRVSVVRLIDGRTSTDDLRDKSDGAAAGVRQASVVAADVGEAGTGRTLPGWTLPVLLKGGRVHFADRKFRTEALVEDLEVTAAYQKGRIDITEGRGRLNGGTLTFAGQVDLASRPEAFEMTVAVAGSKVSSDLSGLRLPLLGYLFPPLFNPLGTTSGMLNLDASVTGRGFDRASLESDLAGESRLEVRDLRIEGSESMKVITDWLSGRLKLSQDALAFDALTAEGRIGDGRVRSDRIRAWHGNDFAMLMSGETDFDGRLDYRMSFEGDKVEKYLGPAQPLLVLLLRGTLERPRIDVGLPGSKEGVIDTIRDWIDRALK